MPATALDLLYSSTASLIPAPRVLAGLPLIAVLPEGSSPLSGGVAEVVSAAGALALEVADRITAQGLVDLQAIFAQSPAPGSVWVTTYASADSPEDALDQLVANAAARAAGVHRGALIYVGTRTDADLVTASDWIGADGSRSLRFVSFAQCDTAGLLTSGKPAALADAEIAESAIVYHATDAEPGAAALAGRIAGVSLLDGPVAAQIRVSGVAVSGPTLDEGTFLLANDGIGIYQTGDGSSAADRMAVGTRSYGGVGLTGLISVAYLLRRVDDAVLAVIRSAAIRGRPIKADASGEGVVAAAISEVLAELAAAGHWTPYELDDGTALPDGWRVVVTSSDGVIRPAIDVAVAREARAYSLTTLAYEV